MNAAHAQAEAIRNTARSANEVGTGDGNTVTKTSTSGSGSSSSGSSSSGGSSSSKSNPQTSGSSVNLNDLLASYGAAKPTLKNDVLTISNGGMTLAFEQNSWGSFVSVGDKYPMVSVWNDYTIHGSAEGIYRFLKDSNEVKMRAADRAAAGGVGGAAADEARYAAWDAELTRIVRQYDDARAQAAREAELARVEAMRPKPILTEDGRNYYASTDDAALAWSIEYNAISIKQSAEYGALMYERMTTVDGKPVSYYYIGPTNHGRGDRKWKSVDIWEGFDDDGYLTGDPIAGFVHTHGSFTNPAYANMSDINVETGTPGDSGVVMALNEWRKYYFDSNGITGASYSSAGYVSNANGQLQRLVITQAQYNAMGGHGATFTDSRYLSIVATGVPTR
jgi:hypothetical protein